MTDIQPRSVPTGPRTTLVIEALAYLGGAIVVAGTMLIGALYWEDYSTTERLLALGAAVAVLLGGGAAVPRRLGDVGSRLRGALWLGATAAFAGLLGVLAVASFDVSEEHVGVLVAAGTAVFAVALWVAHRTLLQQIAMMVALAVTSAAAIADFIEDDSWPGVGIWIVGAAWASLGWGGLLRPRRAALALGFATLLLGSMSTMQTDAGVVLALLTTVALVAVAVLVGDLLLLVIGSVGALVVLPSAVSRWFPETLAAAVSLLVLGLFLVATAIWTARRRGGHLQEGSTIMFDSTTHLASLLDLSGKTAVVTGAAMGIGKSIATELAMAGASVVVADRDEADARLVAKELTELGLDATAITVDVSDEADVSSRLSTVEEWRDGIDILVNNAGIFPTVPVLEMTSEAFGHVIDVNLNGVYLCSRYVAKGMVARGRGGRIINVTSIDALHPSAVGLAHYDASKHAVWGFTKNLALELAPHHIWVNAIAPGGIATPGAARMQVAPGIDPEAMMHAFLTRIPMGRMGEPDDIGKVALFLASDLASYITGTQVVVDGGVLLS